MVYIMMKKKWFTTYLLLTNPTAMLLIDPLSPNINMHLLHTVLHMVPLEKFFFCNATTFHLWIIISLILMTCLFDQAVLLLGEIGCESLLGLKGLMMAHRWSSTSLFPVPFCDSVLLVNPALILLLAFLRLQSTRLNGPLLLSHLCNIFVMWTSLCHLRTPRWLKHLPQCVHSKGFYVSSYCRFKLPRVKL